MKIAIVGYSGSGKSTLARKLGERYGLPVLHLDTVHFLPDWVERERSDEAAIVEHFLDTNVGWVIDGNYKKLSYDRRMEEADLIVMLLFGRVHSFLRAFCRYRRYRHTSRPDMTEGCREKFDLTFMRWLLFGGRSKPMRERYRRVRTQYAHKVVVIKNQRQLDAFEKSRM